MRWHPSGGEAALKEDGELAEVMALLSLGTVGNRLKRDAYIFRGYPGRAALLLGSQSTSQAAIQRLRGDFYNYQQFSSRARSVAGCRAVADRSLFKDVAVEQIMEILRVSNWQATPQVQKWVSDSFDGPLNSKIVEDCFNVLSNMVDNQRNLKTTPKRAFATLAKSEVIHSLHRWPPVSHTTQTSHGRCARLEDTWFKAPLNSPSMKDMRDVQGYNQSVKWYSPGASSISQQATDLELMKYCVAQECRGAKEAWLCTLLRAQNKVAVRRKGKAGEQRWVMPLLEQPDSAAFVWPLEEYRIEQVPDMAFKFAQGIRDCSECIFPVTNLLDLEALRLRNG